MEMTSEMKNTEPSQYQYISPKEENIISRIGNVGAFASKFSNYLRGYTPNSVE
jgi:hypothetical protein